MAVFHGYFCEGCGHTTITDKFYKIKIMHCAVCGNKDRMSYLGEYDVNKNRGEVNQTLSTPRESTK